MKQIICYLAAAMTLLSPAAVNAQRVQPLPDEVHEIRIEGKQRLRVEAGDENRLETMSDKTNIASVRNGRMTINTGGADVTLRLAPWRSIMLRAEDYATLEFGGSLAVRENLTVETEDYAQASFLGDTTDTVRAVTMVLRSQDFSSITSDIILQQYNYELSVSDFSRIVLAGMDESKTYGSGTRSETVVLGDQGRIYRGRVTIGGRVLETDYPKDDDRMTQVALTATDKSVSLVRDMVVGKPSDKQGKKHDWHSGRFDLTLAWGWHNWSATRLGGFGGVDGPAAVGTSMNNEQLELSVCAIENRWLGLWAGLGLEWNHYKFAGSEVVWNTGADPYALALGGDPNCQSSLKTRYVTLPLRLSLGNRDKWHLEITALPGIGWTGKGTGLRREYGSGIGTTKEKDFSVNRSLAPYKLDVRAAVMYDWIGIYVQVATMSTFRNNCEELFPIKFGIIL